MKSPVKLSEGVRLTLTEHDHGLTINLIRSSVRGEGLADKALADLCSWADDNRVNLYLTPSSDFGGSKARLTRWYRRHGFVTHPKHLESRLTVQETMVRFS